MFSWCEWGIGLIHLSINKMESYLWSDLWETSFGFESKLFKNRWKRESPRLEQYEYEKI